MEINEKLEKAKEINDTSRNIHRDSRRILHILGSAEGLLNAPRAIARGCIDSPKPRR